MIPQILLAGSALTHQLKPDCPQEKVANSGAMNAAVGAKGRCDAEELVEQKSKQVSQERG